MGNTKNAVIYARYSSHGQNEQSIEQQFEVCEKYAKQNGYTVVGHYSDEAKTGTNDNRPDFRRMITDSSSGSFQYVIIYKIDRFARNRYQSAVNRQVLKKNGVKVISAMENIGDGAYAIIMEGMFDGLAEHFSVNLSENVRRGMDANAAKCLCTGGNRTLGYNVVNKRYVIDPSTAPIIRTIFEMYAKGRSVQEILHYLNEHHIKSISGKDFKQNNIYYILTNKRYAGYYTYKGSAKKGGIPEIVSEELFERVQKMIEKTKKAPARAKAVGEKYMLSGLMRCGYCGRTVTGISGTSKTGGRKYFYYRCSSQNRKAKCELKSFRKSDLEDFVVEKTLELLTPDTIERISRKIVELCNEARKDKSNLKALEVRLQTAQEEKKNLITAIKKGNTGDILLDELNHTDAEIKDIELEILRENIKYPAITMEKVRFFMEQLVQGNIRDFYFREKLVDSLVSEIKVYNNRITISYKVQDGYSTDYSICFSSKLAGAQGLEP